MVTIADKKDVRRIRAAVDRGYAARARDVLGERVVRAMAIAGRYGVPRATVVFRKMRTR